MLFYVRYKNTQRKHLLQCWIDALFSMWRGCAQRFLGCMGWLHIAAHSDGFQCFSLQPATHNKISSSACLRSEFMPTVEMLSVQTAMLLLVLPQLCELHASLCWGFSWHVNFFGWSLKIWEREITTVLKSLVVYCVGHIILISAFPSSY